MSNHSCQRAGSTAPDPILRANSDMYEWLCSNAQRAAVEARIDDALDAVEKAAFLAAKFHPGRFADGRLENVIFEIGRALPPVPPTQRFDRSQAGGKRCVLHVATDVSTIGGHTRMLAQWIAADSRSTHRVLITRQGNIPVPEWFVQRLQESNASLELLSPGRTRIEHALQLRKHALRYADLVVLHHACNDTVPVLAFSLPGLPPVAILNHADHVYWLGASVADAIISLRRAGAEHSSSRRYVNRNLVLPIPVGQGQGAAQPNERHSVPTDKLVLISVGRIEKFVPAGAYDFFAAAALLLDRLPCAELRIVGGTRAEMTGQLPKPPHERIVFLGAVEDPLPEIRKSDIFLESFPFGSSTSVLEAGLCAIPVVPAYAPLFPLLVANNDALLSLIPSAATEQEYVDQVIALASDAAKRLKLGVALRNRLLNDHTGDGWGKHLENVYETLRVVVHAPMLLPVARCSNQASDALLSRWQMKRSDGRSAIRSSTETASAASYHAGVVAKYAGNYQAARRSALALLVRRPAHLPVWRLFIAAALGRGEWLSSAPGVR